MSEVAKVITHCPVCGARLTFEGYEGDTFIFCDECYRRENSDGPKIDEDTVFLEPSGCETCGNYSSTYPDCQDSCPMFD